MWTVSVQVDEAHRGGGVSLKGTVVGVEVALAVGLAGLDGLDVDVDHEVAGGVLVAPGAAHDVDVDAPDLGRLGTGERIARTRDEVAPGVEGGEAPSPRQPG